MKTAKYSCWLIVLSLQITIFAGSFNLDYQFETTMRFERNGQYTSFDEKNLKKPEGISVPDFKGKPLFILWQTPFDPKGRWIALDQISKNGRYELIYIDSNGDGSLADEIPVKQYKMHELGMKNCYSTIFGPIQVTLKSDHKEFKYHLKFQFYNYDENRNLFISTGCWYEGNVTLPDGQMVTCKLIDYQANGTFNDKAFGSFQSDRIIFGSEKIQYTGNYVVIQGKYYNFSAAKDGSSVSISPAEDITFGNIRFGKDVNEFIAGGENGLFYPKIKDGNCELPVGDYHIDSWNANQRYKNERWDLTCKVYGEKGIFTVDSNNAATLALGQPIISAIEIDERSRDFKINQRFTDQLGCLSVTITKNNQRIDAPKLFIKDSSGDYRKTFDLKYG